MTKTKRSTYLLIGAAVVLVAAATVLCVFLLRPKTTIASLMGLESADQIEKMELATFQYRLFDSDPFIPTVTRKDITGSELGEQYAAAFFSLLVTEYPQEDCVGTSALLGGTPDFSAIIVTVKDGSRTRFGYTQYIMPVEKMRGIVEESKISSYMSFGGPLDQRDTDVEDCYFSVPDSQLFTKDFIQYKVSETP